MHYPLGKDSLVSFVFVLVSPVKIQTVLAVFIKFSLNHIAIMTYSQIHIRLVRIWW